MAVTFILGRAGAGKTRACLDGILHDLENPGEPGGSFCDRRLILLVPEQASFQMEHALATRTPAGGYTRAAVLSFSRLARVVLTETGGEPSIIGAPTRALALRRVVAERRESLVYVKRASETAGFHHELDRLIANLLQEGVSPANLRAAADRLDDDSAAEKTREIADLYAAYMNWVGETRVDAAARPAAVCDRLEKLAWLRAASVWVDGFAGFTGQELTLLVALARITRDMTLTLLVDPTSPAIASPQTPPDGYNLRRQTELTYQRLLSLLSERGVTVNPPLCLPGDELPRFSDSPAILTLERGLAASDEWQPTEAQPSGPGSSTEPPAEIHIHECATVRDELRAAARWIREKIADSGGALRFRDFAVIARDLQPFAQIISDVFTEYELPYFLDRRRPLGAHPLGRFLASIFEAATSDCDVQPMVRLLRTRLLPMSRDAAEQLENLAIRANMRGAALWRQPTWDIRRAGDTNAAFASERRWIVNAVDRITAVARGEEPVTGAQWARLMVEVLDSLKVPARLEQWITDARTAGRWESAETHRLAWEALCATLEDLHNVLGETRLSVDDVSAILSDGLREHTVGLAPPTLDQVLVSSIDRSRHPDIRYAWLFAFNEAIFPARPAEDLLLNTREREALLAAGLPAPKANRDEVLDERMLAYIALTRASHGLTISFSTVAEDGAEMLPSPLVAEIKQALPNLPVTRLHPDPPPVCLAELARGVLSHTGDAGRTAARERLCTQLRTDATQAERLDWLLRGRAYRNVAKVVPGYARPEDATGNVVWDTSPSELENYLQCPFRHFAKHGLGVNADREANPVRQDLGSIAHKLLAEVTRAAMREPGGVRAVPEERWHTLLDEALAGYWHGQPADIDRRRPELGSLAGILAARLRDLIAAHAARWKRGRFDPLHCEAPFGDPRREGTLPGVELPLADGQTVRLHGQIDRVDICRDPDGGLALVYDYKSTAKSLTGSHLSGQRLQLFAYLLATELLPRDETPILPSGVFIAPLYANLQTLDSTYVAEASDEERLMYLYRPRGLFDEAAAARLDEKVHGTHSPVAAMRRKKDGSFYSDADAVGHGAIEARLEALRQTLVLAAEGVRDGCIEVAPLVEKRTLACKYCDYRPVCRFDRAMNRPRAAEQVLPTIAAPTERGATE